MVVNVLATVAMAAALTLLVWIQSQNGFHDRSYKPPYVPKRLLNTLKFIQWLKSKAKSLLFDPIDAAIYGLRVSRTHASRPPSFHL
jgi:hypothetical protein